MGRRIIGFLVFLLVIVSCDPTDLRLLVESKVDTAEKEVPPMVTGVTPEDNEIGVGLRPEIVIDFNKAMNPDTINAATIFLRYQSTIIDTTITPSDDLYTVTLTLDADLAPLTEYVLTISADVADIYGKTLGSDYVTRFRTM